jgi:hypothetical protein
MKPIKGGKHPEKQANANSKKGAAGAHSVSSTSDTEYADVLLEFIQPYIDEEPEIEELEGMLNLGLTAWNLAVIKKNENVIYKEYRKNFLADLQLDEETINVLDDLVKEKEEKYANYNDILTDIQIIENENDEEEVRITVASKPYSQFIQEVLFDNDDEDEDDDEEDYEDDDDDDSEYPDYVNRSAITVIPRQPFIDWMQQLDEPGEPPYDVTDHNTLYLINTADTAAEIDEWLQENFDRLFTNELNDWHEDEEVWPENRTYAMFKEWFDIKFSTMVYDVEEDDINKI